MGKNPDYTEKPKKNRFFSLDDDEPKSKPKIKKNRNKLDQNKFHQVNKKKKIRVKSVKQKLRDVERVKGDKEKKGIVNDEETKKATEKVKVLKKLKSKQKNAGFVDKKYEQIKMIERKKINRQLKKAETEKAPQEVIKAIQDKLNYIKLYPKGMVYISITKDESELSDFAKKQRVEILKVAVFKRNEQIKQKLLLPFEQERTEKQKKNTRDVQKSQKEKKLLAENEDEESEDASSENSEEEVVKAGNKKQDKVKKEKTAQKKKRAQVNDSDEDGDPFGVEEDDFFC